MYHVEPSRCNCNFWLVIDPAGRIVAGYWLRVRAVGEADRRNELVEVG